MLRLSPETVRAHARRCDLRAFPRASEKEYVVFPVVLENQTRYGLGGRLSLGVVAAEAGQVDAARERRSCRLPRTRTRPVKSPPIFFATGLQEIQMGEFF